MAESPAAVRGPVRYWLVIIAERHRKRRRRGLGPLRLGRGRLSSILRPMLARLWSSEPILRGALVLAALAGGDVAISGAGFGSSFGAFGLGWVVGAAFAAALWVVGRVLQERGRALRFASWTGAGTLMFLWLADALGVLARFGTKDHRLAVVATLLSLGLGAAVAVLGVFFQRRGDPPSAWVAQRPRRLQVALRVALVTGAAASIVVDRSMFPDSYAEAHLALRVLALWSLVLALSPNGPVTGPPLAGKLRGAMYLSGLVLGAGAWGLLSFSAEARLAALIERPFGEAVLAAARAPGDFDRDGYSVFLGGGDCAPFDSHISPAAAELPGNGVDDNCRLGDASPNDFSVAELAIPAGASPRSIVLITVDTVHAGRLQVYGSKRKTSPNLLAWSKGARVFERAYTTGGWTSLAISSMLRGVFPRRLRWTRLVETNKYRLLRAPVAEKLKPGEIARMTFAMPLEEPRMSIAWWLQRRGMRTVAIINDGYAEFLDEDFVGEGFDRFVDIDERPRARRKDADVTAVAIKELKRLEKSGQPFFLWVHYFGPHDPSSTHANIPKFGKSVAGKYEHEIRAWDEAISPLLKQLDGMIEKQPLSVMLSADHGEWARKKKRGHGNRLNADTLRVPMLMKGSGVEAGRESAIVSLVDVAATVLALTDTPAPSYLDGTDMRGVGGARILMADTWRYKGGGIPTHDLTAAFDGTHKLVVDQLKQSRRVVKQELFEGKGGENLDGEVDVSALEAALNAYLEASGSLELHD